MVTEKIPVLVIENSEADRKILIKCLRQRIELNLLKVAKSGIEGIQLTETLAPKLIFLKIELSDINGLEVADTLHKKNLFPEIVFLAYSDRYVYDSMKFKPLDYIIKPVTDSVLEKIIFRWERSIKTEDFERKLEKFLEPRHSGTKRKFRTNAGMVILDVSRIVYCKAAGNFTELHLETGASEKIFSTLNQTIEIINSKNFHRTGRSYCINLNFLRKIDKRTRKCFLSVNQNQIMIPVSKNLVKYLESLITYQVF